jgi:redox-regulated HSP33 family molecular chaperone
MLDHPTLRRLCAPLVMAVLMPLAAHGQETVLGTWNGRVDKQVQLTIRGNNVSSNTLSGQQLNGRFRLASSLPREDGTVRLAVTHGRGDVSVVQQPSAQNGYTTIIRLTDRSSGADAYRVTAYFTPATTVLGNRGMGRGRGQMGVPPGRGNRMGNGAVLRWRGDVDADAEIRWNAGAVTQRNLNGGVLRAASSSIGGSMNRNQIGEVTVSVRQGRGRVTVVQQPSASNRWTTVIRISDPQAGYGHYDIDATWR